MRVADFLTREFLADPSKPLSEKLRHLAGKRRLTLDQFLWLKRNAPRLAKEVAWMSGACEYLVHAFRMKCAQVDRSLFQDHWRQLRLVALGYYGLTCACCGIGRAAEGWLYMEVDHVRPFAAYPEKYLSLSNLQILCRYCNRRKGKRVIDYRAKRGSI